MFVNQEDLLRNLTNSQVNNLEKQIDQLNKNISNFESIKPTSKQDLSSIKLNMVESEASNVWSAIVNNNINGGHKIKDTLRGTSTTVNYAAKLQTESLSSVDKINSIMNKTQTSNIEKAEVDNDDEGFSMARNKNKRKPNIIIGTGNNSLFSKL